MKAIITVIGKDTVGILSKVSTVCAENSANIIEVTQSVLQDLFAMIMLAQVEESKDNYLNLSKQLETLGKENNLTIHVMHEDIFNSMHRI